VILFFDTSALVKLYVVEAESASLKAHLRNAEAAAVCRIAWAEAHAAFSRRSREVPEDSAALDQAKALLASDWPRFLVVEVTQSVVERAGEFSDTFALRGYDSIQLAAAHEVVRVSQTAVLFACYDARLNKAAKVLGMQCL